MVKKQGKQKFNSVDQVFENHRTDVQKARFLSNKAKVFVLGCISGFVMIALLFFFSSASKIKGFEIQGNYFLSEEEVLEISGLSKKTCYLFVFDSIVQDRLLNHPFIEDVQLEVRSDRTVKMTLKEKLIIGYRYQKYPEIVFQDGTLLELKNEYADLYSQIPLIVGFDGDLTGFTKAFASIPQKRISSVSEIHRYAYTYDPNGLEFVMKDGNRFFASFYSVDVLDQYNGIASALKEKNVCLYADENSGNVYKSLCPEEVAALETIEAENDENANESKENE